MRAGALATRWAAVFAQSIVLFASALLLESCEEDTIPAEVIEATTPEKKPPPKPEPPPLTPSSENYQGIPIPTGAKHRAMVQGRFRYLVAVSPGEVIGYFKGYVLPASVELEGAATVLRDAVAKKTNSKKKIEIVISPSTPGWTQVEITPEPERTAGQKTSEPEVLQAAKESFEQAL